MKVLIDATGIRKNKAGVGVYAKGLIDNMVDRDTKLEFFILAQNDDPALDYSDRHNVTMLWVPAKLFRILPLRFLLEQFGIPILLLKYQIDVIHSLHYSFPLVHFGAKQVVTLHDMTFFAMPQMHVPFKVFYFRSFIKSAVRFADALIFVSESARRDCVARLGPPRGLTAVIYHGKSAAFRPDIDPLAIQGVATKYGLSPHFLLYVGTIEPRKNLNRLVAAFGSLVQRHPDLTLVIAGMKGWMYDQLFEEISRLNLESRIIFTGFIPEEDKPYLIAAAKVFVYPSLYEGFGLPALEAIACGTPTVTSNTSSLPEVVGEAALLIDPNDEAAIATAIERLLSDEPLRERLRQASINQAAKFNWQTTARLTAETYADVFARKR